MGVCSSSASVGVSGPTSTTVPRTRDEEGNASLRAIGSSGTNGGGVNGLAPASGGARRGLPRAHSDGVDKILEAGGLVSEPQVLTSFLYDGGTNSTRTHSGVKVAGGGGGSYAADDDGGGSSNAIEVDGGGLLASSAIGLEAGEKSSSDIESAADGDARGNRVSLAEANMTIYSNTNYSSTGLGSDDRMLTEVPTSPEVRIEQASSASAPTSPIVAPLSPPTESMVEPMSLAVVEQHIT